MKPDKPPTRESVEAARPFAASLPALPKPRTLENLKQAFDERLASMSDDDILREFAKSTFSETKPTDYERGFADHADFVKTWMRKQATEMYDSINDDTPDDERILRMQCEWAYRYVMERYNERHIEIDPLQCVIAEPVKASDYGRGLEDGKRIGYQAGLRKAASHV